jgi:hypothetical protein
LEGSQSHTTKMAEAKEFFDEHGPSAGEAVGESILALLSHLEIDAEKLRDKASTLPPSDSKNTQIKTVLIPFLFFNSYGKNFKICLIR